MQITRVELDNIKNYEAGSFDLEPGVTAICGPNGSGKTTILEAVSWALFDQLPYKKEDFLKRGARKGSVKVTFISSLDGRLYTVYRDTGTGYHIYDPVTRLRLVEQKGQVAGWIKQHLGVDPTVDLKSLFTSAIGVPQGTFTMDFAEQPARRKAEFDKVLRVDEYQRCSDELLPVVRFAEGKLADLREAIARNEVKVAALDRLTEERRRLGAIVGQLKLDLPILDRGQMEARKELDRLDSLARQIERLRADRAVLEQRISEAEVRLNALGSEVARSSRAFQAVQQSTDGYNAYCEASQRLEQLELEAVDRDRLRGEFAEKDKEHIRLQGTLQNLRDKLGELSRDKEGLRQLGPAIDQQVALESSRRELQAAASERPSLVERLEGTDRELAALRVEYREVTHKIEECEKFKSLAVKTAGLEVARSNAESGLRGKQIELDRMTQRKAELGRLSESVALIEGELKNLESTLQTEDDHGDLVESISALESEEHRTIEEIAGLRAALEMDEHTLAQINGGLCPLLAQRCLNMREGETLDSYFRGRAETDRQQLAKLMGRREGLRQQLATARAGIATLQARETLRAQQSKYRQDLERETTKCEALEKEISALQVTPDVVRQFADRLKAADRELRSAHEAKAKFEAAEPLKERLKNIKAEGEQKRTLRQELEKRLAATDGATEELASVERQIEALGDPRGRARLLEERISNESALRGVLERAEGDESALAQALDGLKLQLQAFDSLDGRMASERSRRAAREREYLAYLENQPIAALLPAREGEFSVLKDALAADRDRALSLTCELETASLGYDLDRHSQAKVRLEESTNRASAAAYELASLQEKSQTLLVEISELADAKQELEALTRGRRQCDHILSVSEMTRDLLKKAAPFVTEALLQSISIEANHLYREITGNALATLRWDSGYEVIVEEEGYDRPFANLSGGEQMAAALSVRLALLKELSDVRIAFFDEPTSNMDEERRHNLAEQIGRIKDFDQLFVISHDDAFEGFTDQIIALGPQENHG
jgi:DNA repair protein SbcC/Rad50